MSMEYYDMVYQCKNCLRGYLIYVPFGEAAENFLACPICGRNELCKTNRQVEWVGVRYLKNGELLEKQKK